MTAVTPEPTSPGLERVIDAAEYRDRRLARAGRMVRSEKLAIAALLTSGFMILIAIAAPVIAPHDPAAQDILQRLRPPAWSEGGDWSHVLGTDQLGRDVLSRLLYGARMSLFIAFASVLVAVSIGVVMGMLSGYIGRWVDSVIMELADIFASFPGILVAIIVLSVFNPSIWLIIAVLGIEGWMIQARMVRGQVKALRETEFVEAARAVGAGPVRIMRKQLLPNIMAALLTLAVLELARLIIAESILSFLGLGVQSPDSSWGLMIGEGRDYITTAWWVVAFPGLAIVLTVLSLNLVSSWLRTATDPFLRHGKGAS